MASTSPELLEMRFKKYLHYGSELPIYTPGDRFSNGSYNLDKVPSLLKLLKSENPLSVVETILKVKKEGTSLWPDTLTFALAVCSVQPDVRLQNAVYKELRNICKTAKEFLLFVKFHQSLKQNRGGGNGFKRAVSTWYLVWMPFDLAEIFLNQQSYYGWSHVDIIRLAHVKPVSIEQEVLFAYVTKGVKEAKEKFGDSSNEQVKELIEYITTVENFKKIRDPQEAAKHIGLELHSIERVPTDFFKCQEVWNELIPNMDVQTLLDNLQRISIHGFLKNSNVTVMKVVDVFNNLHKAETFKGHPSRVYIELLTYEKAAKYCLDVADKLNHPISKIVPARKPPKTNLLIKNALTTFFYGLFKLLFMIKLGNCTLQELFRRHTHYDYGLHSSIHHCLKETSDMAIFQKPTGLRYLVTVDLRAKMFSDRCHYRLLLTPIEAAQAVCLSLVRTEPDNNVTIGVFTEAKGIVKTLPFSKRDDLDIYKSTFEEELPKAGPASVASAIHWATSNKKPVDVFIVLSNYLVSTSGARSAINKYRTEMELPNSKVVTCSLSGKIRTHKDVEGQNMLCVIGFDENVCRLIEVFARDCF